MTDHDVQAMDRIKVVRELHGIQMRKSITKQLPTPLQSSVPVQYLGIPGHHQCSERHDTEVEGKIAVLDVWCLTKPQVIGTSHEKLLVDDGMNEVNAGEVCINEAMSLCKVKPSLPAFTVRARGVSRRCGQLLRKRRVVQG